MNILRSKYVTNVDLYSILQISCCIDDNSTSLNISIPSDTNPRHD